MSADELINPRADLKANGTRPTIARKSHLFYRSGEIQPSKTLHASAAGNELSSWRDGMTNKDLATSSSQQQTHRRHMRTIFNKSVGSDEAVSRVRKAGSPRSII
jgi:hypothetical protein